MRLKFQEKKKGQEIWGWERWTAAAFAGYRVTVINRHDPLKEKFQEVPIPSPSTTPGLFFMGDSHRPLPLFPMSYGKQIPAGLQSTNLSPQQRILKSNHPKPWAPWRNRNKLSELAQSWPKITATSLTENVKDLLKIEPKNMKAHGKNHRNELIMHPKSGVQTSRLL